MRLFCSLLLLISFRSSAQTDTIYGYYNRDWNTVAKDSAFYFSKIFRENKKWHRIDYWVNTGKEQMDGWYRDRETKIQSGILKFYNETGILTDSLLYDNGREKFKYTFYPNHTLKGFVIFDRNGNSRKQGGFTPDGHNIPNYIFEQDASFPGGDIAWQRYLEENLNVDVALNSNAPAGTYAVVVQFLIEQDGSVDGVIPVVIPDLCKPCVMEAVRVIMKSPKWNPAIRGNEKVIYRHRQQINFSVIDNTQKGN